MRILFVWTGVTSYMADCWRKLAAAPGIELKIVLDPCEVGHKFDSASVFEGLEVTVADPAKAFPELDFAPDAMFVSGWHSKLVKSAVEKYPDVPKVCCFDMPWRNSPRCFAARFALRGWTRRFAAAYVAGRSAERYANWLGFRRVFTGVYSIDTEKFARAAAKVAPASRAGFLFVGRKVPEKGLDILAKAYELYRERGGTWKLDIPDWIEPGTVPEVMASHACLVLPSRWEPWGVVVAEAKSAGMKVIASDQVGARLDIPCDGVFPSGDASALADRMLAIERGQSPGEAGTVPRETGTVPGGIEDISYFSSEKWVRRTISIFREIVAQRRCYCPGMGQVANGMAVVSRFLAEDPTRPANEFIVHGAWSPTGWWQALKTLVSQRQSLSRRPAGSFSPIYLERQSKWKKRLVKPIERWLLRKADRVIATCEEEKRWILDYEPKAKVEIVDLKKYFKLEKLEGLEGLDKLEELEQPGAQAPLKVLYLGRRHPLKGIEYLEQAVERGNEELRIKNEEWSDGRMGIELRVVSEAKGEEKEREWEWCDVLCLPTLSENFGLVIAEALERGKRVITTDGAPAWKEYFAEHPEAGVYLEGYRAGGDQARVDLLVKALRQAKPASTTRSHPI